MWPDSFATLLSGHALVVKQLPAGEHVASCRSPVVGEFGPGIQPQPGGG